jgi:hypothetical protein
MIFYYSANGNRSLAQIIEVLLYFDNYIVLTKNVLTLIAATLFQYACQSNLPSTVRVLVQIGFANIQARNSDTGNCYKELDKH